MIVRLKVNLKVTDGTVFYKGTVFSNEEGEQIPEFVADNMDVMEVLSGPKSDAPAVPVLRRKAK